jgi:hypothetical protein
MCWNEEVSLNTFIFGIVSAAIVLAINKNEFSNVLFLLSVTFMQLIEYFAWRNIHNKEAIKFISICGMVLILLQLIILNTFNLQGNERIIILIVLFITSLLALIHIVKNNKLQMNKAINGHLAWHWVDLPIPLLIVLLSLYLYSAIRNKEIIILFLIIILLSISLFSYYKYKTWGSMWCYISNIFWLVLIAKVIYEHLNIFKK